MKIEHEIKGVNIVRYRRSLAEVLNAFFEKPSLRDGVYKQVLTSLHLDTRTKMKLETERQLAEMLSQTIPVGFENEEYQRTLALVSFTRDMKASEFLQKLSKDGYCPASLSESSAYMPLVSRMAPVDAVFHFGTLLRNEEYIEFRLLTRKSGDVELVPFFPTIVLKKYYHIIVVKKEKK